MRHRDTTTGNPLRPLIITLVFGFAFVINPAYITGCDSSGEEDDFDTAAAEADLLEELDDVNATAAFEFEQGSDTFEVLLALSQQTGEDRFVMRRPAPGFMPSAHACGTHTLYQSASACATTVQLAVEGTLTLRRLDATPVTVVSDVAVTGTLMNYGMLELSFGDATLALDSLGGDGYALTYFEATALGAENIDISLNAD